MASDLDNLIARRSAVYAELAALTPAANGGKPTYSIDGQSVDHVGYRKSLLEEIQILNALIAAAQGPFEVIDRAVT